MCQFMSLGFLLFIHMDWIFGKIISCSDPQASEVCHVGEFYDQSKRPDTPVIVSLNIIIKDITKVSEEDQTVTIGFEIHMSWIDKRITLKEQNGNQSKYDFDSQWRLLSLSDLDQVWSPVLYIVEALKIDGIESFGNQNGITRAFWYLHPNQFDIFEVLSVTITCDMHFEQFPYDDHICPFQMRVWNGRSQFVQLKMPILHDQFHQSKKAKIVKRSTSKLNFDVEIVAEKPMEKELYSEEYTYSHAILNISLVRKHDAIRKIIPSYYAPTGIFTVLSFLSFTIKPDQVRAEI